MYQQKLWYSLAAAANHVTRDTVAFTAISRLREGGFIPK